MSYDEDEFSDGFKMYEDDDEEFSDDIEGVDDYDLEDENPERDS